MGFADDWGSVYNKGILAFTGRKKVAVHELEEVVKGTSALVTSLAALDRTDPAEGRPEEAAAKHKAFIAEQKKLAKAADKYAAVLDGAIAATDKILHAEAYRELKVLRKQLDLVVAKVESKAVSASKEYGKAQTKLSAEIQKTENKLRGEGLDDNQVNAEINYLRQQRLLVGWPALTKAALAKAAAAVPKIKADPTPATYKREMAAGGRDISQQMSNLIKLISDPKCPDSLSEQMAGLADHGANLAAFGNGDKREVAGNATAPEVLARIKEFAELTKALVPYYDRMVKYLSKHKL